jgi:hypothetical protein
MVTYPHTRKQATIEATPRFLVVERMSESLLKAFGWTLHNLRCGRFKSLTRKGNK